MIICRSLKKSKILGSVPNASKDLNGIFNCFVIKEKPIMSIQTDCSESRSATKR